MRALVHKEVGFDRISVEDAYIFGFQAVPKLNFDAIAIADQDHPLLIPGEYLIGIGGKKTSAGFKNISLHGCAMGYCGSVMMDDFELLCFQLFKSGMPCSPDFYGDYAAAYYGWLRLSREQWFVSNTAGAGRIIETAKISVQSQC